MKMVNQSRTYMDDAWKEILDGHLQRFMQLFFPDIYEQINWNRPYVSLEQELYQTVREAKVGKRYVDNLL